MLFVPPQAQEKKISLNIQQVITPPPAPKPTPKPLVIPSVPSQPVVQKEVKPTPKKEEVKKKLLDKSQKIFAQKSSEENNVTKVEPKPQKKIVKKEVTKKPKKIVKQKRKKKKRRVKKRKSKRSNDRLANALMGSASFYPTKSPSPSRAGSYGDRMIKKLYGSEFNTYSPTQKKFIRNNLGTIHRITQRTLTRNGYPDVAVSTGQQGTNVVAFYLHPNGDITGLRLNRHIGYEALDKNTLQVIRLAYKDYPLPNKKTKIIFYVRYSMY
jgi:TonB family protein